MQIAICDDERSVCRQLREWILIYAEKESIEVKLKVFYSAEDLLRSLADGNWYDMIFQDIELPKKSGLDIAKELRSYVECNQVVIDFISGKQEYGMSLFDLQPINFRLKPLKQEEIEADLSRACRILQERKHALTYVVNNIQNGILLRDICFIESKEKMIHVHTLSGKTINFWGTLYQIEKEYSSYDLFRCHRSFIVNLHYICGYKNRKLTMKNGEMVDVGKMYVNEFKERLRKFDFGEE